jgi:hypothetical protein
MKQAVILFISLLSLVSVTSNSIAQNSRERASFDWKHVPLRVSLDSLMKWYSESIVYLDGDVEGKEISASCRECGFDEALSSVLRGNALNWIRRGNQIILRTEEIQKYNSAAAIAGVVTDSLTGEWVPGASVLLQKIEDGVPTGIPRWCPTNAFGFYSLPDVSPGRYVLVVRALGYEVRNGRVDSVTEKPIRLNISMIQKAIVLNAVTIEGHRQALAAVEEFSHSTFYRSVPSDPNQYMLDGGRIYNPSHFGGVLSTFSPEVLTEVQILLGGLPPSYGGRLGSIVDLSMRDGMRQRFAGSAGAGTLGSRISLEGPFAEGTSFLVSGRSMYPDAAMRILSPHGVTPSQTGSLELTSKLTHRMSSSGQISLSSYFGRDTYSNSVEDGANLLNNDFSWGNSMVDLRWIGIASPSLFLHAAVVYSRYSLDLQHHENFNISSPNGLSYPSYYSIEDWNVNVHAENYYTEDHTLRAGIELIHHTVNGSISTFSSQIAPYSLQNNPSWETALYLQDQWKILPRVLSELGGRVSSFSGSAGSFSAIDPRFSLLITMDDRTHLYTSLSAISQFLHPYRNSGVFLFYPAIFWYPSTGKMQPSTSLHATLGVERTLEDDAYILSAETYYRITNNLHEFGYDTTSLHSSDLEQASLSGTGRTYGIMVSARKRLGDLTGSINYNLSWSYESFSEINGGSEFVPPFNRRHELQAAAEYTFGEQWTLGAFCVVASGQTLPSEPASAPIFATGGKTDRTGVGVANALSTGFTDINGSKLPGFQRLELNISRQFVLSSFHCEGTFRLLNGYGLIDPFQWNLDHRSAELRWNAVLKEVTLFPLYPSIELVVRF